MKLVKSYYYGKNGEKKVNTYLINIPRAIVEETKLQDKQLKVTAKGNKIIIERSESNDTN